MARSFGHKDPRYGPRSLGLIVTWCLGLLVPTSLNKSLAPYGFGDCVFS